MEDRHMLNDRLPALGAATTGLLLAGTLTAAPPAAAESDAAEQYGQDAFAATNTVRRNHDRRVLRHQRCLEKYAARQARRMARQERIWHQDLGRVLRDCHMGRVGENVAAGFRSGRSVVRDGWMESQGHRRNILDRRFRMVEVEARRGDDGRWYAAQVFGRR
jgi:uncharacterized protein YkwD